MRRRPDVRAAARAARETGVPADVVGGAVRDAFLSRSGGDLDLSVTARHALAFAQRLAGILGTRVVAVGTPPKRILKLPAGRHEVDVWERGGSAEEDLARRDFTLNALRVALPAGTLDGPPGALDDLARGHLRPPRPGVLVEDPLRVLRAARFEATLPGFRLVRSAVPECRLAALRLHAVPVERCLVELDRLLGAPPPAAAAALLRLESWGALAPILPGTTAASRRAGVRNVARLSEPSPAVARALLLLPSGAAATERVLGRLRASARDVRMASRLLSLPLSRRRGPATRREVARLLRAAAPFSVEAVLFLAAAGDRGTRELAAAAAKLAAVPARLRRVLSPARPLGAGEVAAILALPPGPELGRALAALDGALADGDVRGKAAARAFLLRRAGSRDSLTPSAPRC